MITLAVLLPLLLLVFLSMPPFATLLCGPCTALPTASKVSITVSGFGGAACCSGYNVTLVVFGANSGTCAVQSVPGGGDGTFCALDVGQSAFIITFFLSGGTAWIRVRIFAGIFGDPAQSVAVYEVDTGVASPVDCGGASLQGTWNPAFVSQTGTKCDGSAATVSVTISP